MELAGTPAGKDLIERKGKHFYAEVAFSWLTEGEGGCKMNVLFH